MVVQHEDVDAIAERANRLANEGRVSEALPLWEKAIKLKPSSAHYQVFMGHALAALGRKRDAEAAYRAAIGLSPRWIDAHLTLGLFLARQGRLNEAIDCCSRALSCAPELAAKVQLVIGNLRLKNGDIDGALAGYDGAASAARHSEQDREFLLKALRALDLVNPLRDKLNAAFSGLEPRSRSIAEIAHKHLRAAQLRARSEALQPSPFWTRILSQNAEELPRLTTAKEALIYLTDAFNINMEAETTSGCLPLYIQTLKAEFPHFSDLIDTLECSPLLASDRLVSRNGRLTSSGFLCHLRSLLVCLTWIEAPSVVCEIGGGYGGLASLWMSVPERKPDLYILIDFPESLFFAEIFIRANDPHARLLYLDRPEDVKPEFAMQYDYILCPSDLAEHLAKLPIGIVVNMFSFQEMTEAAHSYWMEWLDRQQCRYLYSLNIFGLPFSRMDSVLPGCALWSPRPGNSWTPRLLNAHAAPLYAYGQPIAEAIFEKTGNRSPAYPVPSLFTTREAFIAELYGIQHEADHGRVLSFARRWSHQRPILREVIAVLKQLLSSADDQNVAREANDIIQRLMADRPLDADSLSD